MVSKVVRLRRCQLLFFSPGRQRLLLTLKAALYGRPIGRLARIANNRFARGALNARLWEISCMARKRF